jgi:hypothetical protein
VNLDPPQPGYPFEGDYPEPAYEPDQPEFQEVLRELAGAAPQPEGGWRQQVVDAVNEQRDAAGLPAIEVGSDGEGSNVLYARRQIVTTQDCYQIPALAEELNTRRYRQVDVGHRLPEGILVLEAAETPRGMEDLLDMVRYVRARGCPASLNYITPLAGPPPPPPPSAVGKSVGPPVLGPCFGPFAEYRAPFPEPPEDRRPIVGIIDVGVPSWVRADGWLADVPRTPSNIDLLDGLPADGKLDAFAGHGTFVAGIVAQVAPWAHVRVYRALTSDGFGTDAAVAATIVAAVTDGARIINLSLGCQTPDNLEPVAMATAIDQLRQQLGDDLVIIAAAGNFGNTRLVWPAAIPGVVSVAGLTPQMRATNWSTRGSWVTSATVGQGIRSLYVDISYLTPPAAVDPCARWIGTSFAAPQIAGAVARACYELDLTPQAAVDKLLKAGAPLKDFGQTIKVLPGTP